MSQDNSSAAELNIDQITKEILNLKQQVAKNIIDIGKRLIRVKASLEHGEWGKYLKERVDFTQETARKFMIIAKELGNSKATWNMNSSEKLWLILTVPSEDREKFLSSPHMLSNGETKMVNEMSTRELQSLIKKEKEQATDNNDVMREIPIDLLVLNPRLSSVRKNKYDGIGGLAQNIENIGLIHPIHVARLDSKFEIICGYRRYYACKMLGFKNIPCFVWEINEECRESLLLKICWSENSQRKSYTLEEFYNKLRDLLVNNTIETIERKLGINNLLEFVNSYDALKKMRDKQGYIAAGHSTFGEYCKYRFGFSVD